MIIINDIIENKNTLAYRYEYALLERKQDTSIPKKKIWGTS